MTATTNKLPFQNSDNARSGIIAVFWLTLLLCSCSPLSDIQKEGLKPTTFFLPPTPQPTQSIPTPDPNHSDAQPPVVECEDQLLFIQDVTIPDGSAVAPDSTMDKRWEVENKGNCNWDKSYRLRLIAGPGLGAIEEQALFPARSGTRTIIRLVFKAPQEPGAYHSAWQAYNPAGEPFGDPFFIDFVVE